jgi:peptide/nickel transport system ATP-binding protein
MHHTLEVKDLSISFTQNKGPQQPVLQGLSFDLPAGQTLGMVGESGSGKTMSTLAIMGLLPGAARLEVDKLLFSPKTGEQHDLAKLSALEWSKIRGRHVGMIFQEPLKALNPILTCGTQIAEVLQQHQGLKGKALEEAVMTWLEKVKLPDLKRIYQSYPHQLSGGQRQRVMIAAAMCCQPALLLADEPTTALDLSVQHEVLKLIRELTEAQGTACIFISHDLSVVKKLADQVLVLRNGQTIEYGSAAEVLHRPKANYTRALLACKPPLLEKIQRLPMLKDVEDGKAPNSLSAPASDADAATVLAIEDLSAFYQGSTQWFWQKKLPFQALDGINLHLGKGQTLGLVGESGSGKTTLARCILNLVQPQSGKIWYEGQEIQGLNGTALKKLRKKIQVVFQDPFSSLNPRISIGEAIMEPMQVHGIGQNQAERQQKAFELLAQVGMVAEHFERLPAEFSGGQRQRIAIARALAVEPDLLILDEAVSSLDVSIQAQVLNLLKDLQEKRGLTYLFISHDLAVIRFMSDQVAVMRAGQVIEYGQAAEVFLRPREGYTQELLGAAG